jgi:putative tryptophan/tyrosine transport system substrate-binding protein
MKRREFIAAVSAAASWPAGAQHGRATPVIGVLWHAGSAEEEGSNFSALDKAFRDLGYQEGRNIRLEHRFPNEMPERFRGMAAELVASNVDVLIVVGNNAAPYAKQVTSRIPIVFTLVADPLGMGLVDSLARPNGNVTGIANSVAELIGKRLELLRELMPELSRHAVLLNPQAHVARQYREVTMEAGGRLGLSVRAFEWRSVDDLEPAFKAMSEAGMQSLTTNPDGLAFTHRELVAKAAIRYRLPLCVWSRPTLTAGAVLAYGADTDAVCYRAAHYVDRILKGAKPGELPVEQPAKFELTVNLRTARAIGLVIPEAFLARADEVIE